MDSSSATVRCCLQHAAHLTNLGAHYLSTENDHQAFGAYKRALDILQDAANNDAFFETSQSANDGDAVVRPPLAVPFAFGGDGNDETAKNGMTAEDEDKSYFFVFSKPFVYDIEALDASCTPIYLAIIIFGMTLLLLRKARKEPDNRSLHKALRLSDMALSLLQSAPKQVDSSNILLAILNNKIYVCYSIHQFDEAHEALEELSDLLPAVCTDDSTTFEESEMNGMILNSLSPPDPTRLAPAA